VKASATPSLPVIELPTSKAVLAAADTMSFASDKLLPKTKAREKSVKEYAKAIADVKADLIEALQVGIKDSKI